MSDPRPASRLLDHCPQGLPRVAYVTAEWFAREQATIRAQNWVVAGRAADLPPFPMRAVKFAGFPVLLCRDPEAATSAFHNIRCHRGAELCKGKRKMGKPVTCHLTPGPMPPGTGV